MKSLSWLAIVGTIAPAIAFVVGAIALDTANRILLVATVLWFVARPLAARAAPTGDPR